MTDTLYLAWRYVTYNKGKTAVLIVALTLILCLPITLTILAGETEQQLMARAQATPLIVGAKGSSLDLAINALYFEPKRVEPVTLADADRVDKTGLARAIPLYTRFRAAQHTIVGTTLDYFGFRQLAIAGGRQMTRLGDCVVGAEVAERLDLKPGGRLLSSPENVFDLAGVYPLNMRVTGVLKRAHTPDDLAVFVDLKTAWIIEGLGHGHQDLRAADPSVLLKTDGGKITANAKLVHYNEITDKNAGSFHFHGAASKFPVTAILAVPPDKKSEDLLRGRFLDKKEPRQVFRPIDVIRGLTATIFKVKGILDATFGLVLVATVLLIGLVVVLSLRLRRREVQTMFKLGCGRLKIAGMLTAEVGLVLLMSLVLTGVATVVTVRYVDEILRRLIL